MNVNDLFNRQSAKSGFKQVSGTSAETAVSGTYFAVQFITECTTTAFTAQNSVTVAAVTYPAGVVVYGNITAITCSADNIYILYKS
tara:strand:+ start:2563 stop:2820 length:258 start_codon:yes stop_codon:yes gene_type:complete